MIRKPFNFSPDLSQKMHLEDREDEEDDEDDDEVSFLSMLRKEAEVVCPRVFEKALLTSNLHKTLQRCSLEPYE